jgi:tape measure domain-containing protein
MEGGDLSMTSVDERIVRMKFDNAQFASGASSTLNMLDKLKAALRFDGASQGLNEASNAVNNFSTDRAQGEVSALGQKFSALQIAAISALNNIVSKAVDAGLSLAKSLTIDPVSAGFKEYETNLNSIQTILANTGLKGAEGLSKVTDTLDNLNHYADQTIYNFSEMARNIGTFTAAGVKLDVATSAIKGIANLAAVSGSNAEQASAAMYQLSQAISAGKVTLEDWNSVVNAGMGGKVFQDSLVETARVHGVKVDDIIKKQGSFRSSLEKGWLTSEILTETLTKFTGELSLEQLKSMGYTDQQALGILEMGKTAVDAATKIKTFSQLIDTLREGVSSGWAKTWQIVFGDFDEAKTLFTEVGTSIGGMLGKSADARNELLQGWKDLGGRQALIDGLSNAFKALMSFLKPIGDAFRQIFPKTTAQELYNMTVAFRDFMAKLKLGSETADNLRRTFAGFFAILGIGWELIKAGVKFIFNLVGSLTSGSGGFLKFTGNIGDFLVALHSAIKEGEGFTKFFQGLGKVLQVPINLIRSLAQLLGKLFSGASDGADTAKDGVSQLTSSLTPLQKLSGLVKSAWNTILQIFSNISQKVKEVAKDFVAWASGVGAAISGAFDGGLNFDSILGGVQTGLFAGLVLLLRKFVGSISDFLSGESGIFQSLIGALDGLTGALKGMQNALNAVALLAIAAAVGILALALIGLSKIDQAGLIRASIAIGVMFTQLSLAFMAFNRMSSGGSAVKVGIMSAGLILLAVAVNVLASAVKKLGELELKQLQKGLFGVAALLTMLVAATNRLDTNTSGIVRTAAGMILLGVAIRVLVESVEELGKMDWESLAKGLVGVGVLLASLALFTRLAEADKGGIGQGIGIILLATALKILASAVGDFQQFNWEQLGRGMAGIAVGLTLITAAMNLLPSGSVLKAAGVAIVAASLKLIAQGVEEMSGLSWGEIARGMTVMAGALISIALALRMIPSGSLLSAAAVLVVASSLGLIQEALGKMSGMTWGEIAKGLTVLAASLILIAGAVRIMQGALSGAAAILIVVAALRLLLPVLTTLGEMSWESIIKGLVGLAGVFVIIGVAGLLLGPLAPVIVALAVGIALLGVAVLAAGLGVLAFAIALGVLAAAGAGAVAAIVGIVSGLVGLIPYVMEQIARGLIAFAQVIATSGPAILGAITTVLNAFLDAIIQATPKIVQALVTMLYGLLDAIVKAVPKIVDAGVKLVVGFIKGIADNLGKVIDQGVNLVVALLDGIGRNIGRLVLAGVDLVFKFIDAIANAIRSAGPRLVDAGLNIAGALIEGIVRGIAQLVRRAIDAIVNMARSMWEGVKDFFTIFSPSKKMAWLGKQLVLGTAKGLDDNAHIAVESTVGMGEEMLDAMGKTLDGFSKALGSDLIDFDPTITPVLDLSKIKKDAGEINDLLKMPEFSVSSTYTQAKDAGDGFESNRTTEDSDGSDGSGDAPYVFNQTNNSPKALSAVEIYRQTENLIARTKRGGNNA